MRTLFSQQSLLGLLAIALAFVSCAQPSIVEQPLFDALHVPVVLTPGETVGWPASSEPNRYIKGWWDYSRTGKPRLTALEGARIQGVKLGSGPKSLKLEANIRPERGGHLEARVADGPWRRFDLSRLVRIPISKKLPPGRFNVDLRLPEGSEIGIRRAYFTASEPAGEVRAEGKLLIQSGFSLVETVRRLEAPVVLSGHFRPPDPPTDGQSFAIEVERSGAEPEVAFEWKAGAANEGTFEIPLPASDEWVRLRFLALGAGQPGRWSGLTVRSSASSSVPTTETAAPPVAPRIVVLYVMDALRSDYLGHLGGPEGISPTIDRLASEGVTFRSHLSVAPNTVPSMKSLFTGQVFLYKGGHKLTRESGPTLAERFAAAGYKTGLFSGNGNVTTWRGMARGFEKVASGVLWGNTPEGDRAGYNDNAEQVHRAALRWIQRQAPEQPLFLHLQTIHPHNPYDPPEPFASEFLSPAGRSSQIDGQTETLLEIQAGRIQVSAADRERLRGLYAGGVAYNDAHLADFLKALVKRYPRHEILFVLTSDHGEELFEHGGVLHGYTLYDEMLRVPLVAWWPGQIEPGSVEALTDSLDLYASLAHLASQGDEITGAGRSLWPYLLATRSGEPTGRELVYASASAVAGGIFMVRSPRYKYVYAPRSASRGTNRWGMGKGLGRGYDGEYLFDLEQDPAERVNLAGSHSLEADWLRSRLLAWIEAGKALEAGSELDQMDEATRESLRALGYLQ